MSNNIADIRNDYRLHTLNESELPNNPLLLFESWLRQAITSDEREPTAMCLSTIEDNVPDARIVLLKEVANGGFVFFTNYDSAKAGQLAANPAASLTFFWSSMERQVRIGGRVEKVGNDVNERYFMSRPAESRAGAWLSPQSKVVSQEWIIEARNAVKDRDVIRHNSRPPFWGGYLLMPNKIEFWQGGAGRLHDRLRYDLEEDVWKISRLAP